MHTLKFLILALAITPAIACAQTAPPALPQVRSSDGKVVVRATPIQCVDNSGNLVSCGGAGGGGSGGGEDVGTVNTVAPSYANQNAGRTATGTLIAQCVDSAGKACAPVAGVSNRLKTKTSVPANTSTVICPAVTNPVYTEIQATGGALGIGIDGQTLTTASITTAASSSDFVLPNALSTYIPPVAPTNAITAYGPAQIVVCIQTLRQ